MPRGDRPRPDLSESKLIEIVAGVRPCRASGLRIETALERAGTVEKPVVHHYGHGGSGYTTGLGSAECAAQLTCDALQTHGNDRVAVIGGGIIGLYTARTLTQRGITVTVYAEKHLKGTASAVAGGLWLPTGVNFGDSPERVAWFLSILRRSLNLLRALDPERYAYETLPVYEPDWAVEPERYFDNGTIEPPRSIDRFPIEGLHIRGATYDCPFIHAPIHAAAIAEDARSAGARFETQRFISKGDVLNLDEPVIVNCSALGSRELFDDTEMFGARGTLAKFEPQDLGYIWHDSYRYIFPRRDALIVGGSFEPNVETTEPNHALIRERLEEQRARFGQAGDIATAGA
ncbi:MAG: FAD-dependent oxidoreductase [Planctomycetota bacterium]